ncbi:MAG: trypsin-like peptidase domain-containing protein [Burkholderiaceae bacterium]|jgi:serine protease DegQ|nr:trypsin-like peptidase domain-containing protein [Burkholderiaceae bacterium]
MKKLWLIFAQTVTTALAIVFVVQIFYPRILNSELQSIENNFHHSNRISSSGSYSVAAEKAMPSVVNIFTSKKKAINPHQQFLDDPVFKRFFGDQMEEPSQHDNSLGSGVIVNSDGLILTNQHVIEAADEIEVALEDGRSVRARIVGSDPDTDLAVLKIDVKNLPSITFADPKKNKVGDVVLAIGNPFGVGQTVTQGIISALGRNHLGISTFESFIQTDASINPGNSGGALIDAEGNLVGINSAIYSRNGGSMGIGFAIPVSIAKQVMEQIVRQGSVTRGWLGIEAQDLTLELADSFQLRTTHGALIAGIIKGSPAERAGLKVGDVLIEINSMKVIDGTSMIGIISELNPNKQAILKIARNHKEIEIPVMIGLRPKLKAN